MSKGGEQKSLWEAQRLYMAVTEAHSKNISCILTVECFCGEGRVLNFTLYTVESYRGLLSMEVF